MSVFKKSGEGFLARLFKHKKIDELAEELVHTYADEIRENMLSENAETEQIPMLEVTKSGEVDFDDQPENSEENSPPSTEKSEVRDHLISFRVNDDELEAINSSISNSFDQIAHRGVLCVDRLNTLLMGIRPEIIRFLKLLYAWKNQKGVQFSLFLITEIK